MNRVKLAEIVKELESGSRPKGGVSVDTGSIPSLGAEHLADDGGFNFHKNKFIQESFFSCLRSGVIKKNDILIVKDGATTGKVSYVQADFPFERAAINEHVFRIAIDERKGFSKFVYYFLRSTDGKKQILNDFRGATVGGISRQFIKSTKIPLPPLTDQIRIATVLTRAERLIAKRKESIKALNELLKSTFLEIFGNPVRNEKGFNVVSVNEVSTAIKDGPHVSPKYVDAGIPILSTRNIRPGELLFDEVKYVSEKTYAELTKRFKPQKNDVLITKGGTTGFAKAVDFDFPFCIWVHLAVIRPNEKVLPIYLEHFFNSDYGYYQSQKFTRGIANRDLGLTRISKIELLLPPISLQNQFAAIVEKIESIKAKQTQSLADLENLYGSLSQRAFKGELDLSRVPVARQSRNKVNIEEIEIPPVDSKTREMKFSEEHLNAILRERKGEVLSLKELWDIILHKAFEPLENGSFFEELPEMQELQGLLINNMESKTPDIEQVFDILSSEKSIGKAEKQIALRIKE